MKKLNARYVAGLFDGEGCIGIWKRFRKNTIEHFLSVDVTNSHRDVIYRLKKQFRGHVCIDMPKFKTHRISYRWRSSGPIALSFLTQIYPHLIIKRKQAKLGIRFQKSLWVGWGIHLKGNTLRNRDKLKKKISLLNHGKTHED